jgi:hypothetical protein
MYVSGYCPCSGAYAGRKQKQRRNHQEIEWPGVAAVRPAAPPRIQDAGHSHPDERDCPNGSSNRNGDKQAGNDRGMWNPPGEQAGARATQPVAHACVSLSAHRRLARAARGRAALARTRGLNRRARHRAIGTEHATIARLWLQLRAAAGAFIEELAGIRRHGFRFRERAVRTGDGRL